MHVCSHKHINDMEMYTTQKFAIVVVTILVVLGGCFGCLKDERNALLQLKSAINDYPNAAALPDWKEEEAPGRPSDCCDWKRVYCDPDSGGVMELFLGDVRGAKEEWYLNASLFLPFTHLRHLHLRGNSIIGWTHHLRQLSSLEELYLMNNKLNGMIDLYDIEALQNLRLLDLGGNSVDGFKRIHGGRRNNNASKLEELHLYNITFQDANTLLDSLVSFPSLNILSLRGNDFKGVIGTDWLCKFKMMEELDISWNGLYKVPLYLRNLTSLQYLDLTGNNLHGQLPYFLANLTSLQVLDLSSNQLVGNVENSPLTKLTSLQNLLLSNNKFQIPQTFKPFANHSNLRFVVLDGNDVISDYSSNQPFIPKFQLSYLSLSNCNISAILPGFILHQHNLTYLDLSHNYIHGSFPAWIIENNTFLSLLSLANNLLIGSTHWSRYPHTRITFVDVSYNNINYLPMNLSQTLPNILHLIFSKNSIKALESSTFGDMKNLSWLDLSYNELPGEMPKGWLKGCFSLEALFLSHNTLEIIPSLSTSFSLKVLLLNNNNFSGVIPLSLFLVSLEWLDLSSNRLGGLIPTVMCKLTNLISIDLSNNSFSGFLPHCFNSPYLLFVYLYKNKLNGPLLPVFKNNTSLITLDLGDNHLNGVIPKWIGNLSDLSILSLQNNHFEGHIPAQVCLLDKLTILDISNNNIDGPIPRCFGQMSFQPLEIKSSFTLDRDFNFNSPIAYTILGAYFIFGITLPSKMR